MHSVNHDDGKLERTQVALQPSLHLALRSRHEAPTDSALARAPRLHRSRSRLERALISTSRDSDEHLLEGSLGEGVFAAEVLPARQHHLVAIDGARPRAADGDPPTPKRQLAWRVTIAVCPS